MERHLLARRSTLIRSLGLAMGISILAAMPGLVDAHGRHGEHGAPQFAPPAPGENLVPTLERGERSESAQAARALMREAVRLTGSGDHDGALAKYREAVEVDMNEGLPALARFLALAGLEEERADFVARMKEDSSIADGLRARALTSAGDRSAAIELLRESPETNDSVVPNSILLLANLLDREGEQAEATKILANAMGEGRTSSPLVAEAVIHRLGVHGYYLEPEDIIAALDASLNVMGTGARGSELREAIDGLVFGLQMEDYFLRRDSILEAARAGDVGGALLEARMLVHEDEHDQATYALEESERRLGAEAHGRRLLLEEKLWLLRAVGRTSEARLLSAQLAGEAEGESRSQLALDAARISISRGNWEEALRDLDRVDPSDLNRTTRRLYRQARFEYLGYNGDIEGIVDYYGQHAAEWNAEDRDSIFRAIFRRVEARQDRLAMESQVRRVMRDSEGGAAPPELWLLAARAAIEGKLKPNELEARAQYTAARPDDIIALEELALEATKAAMELPTLPPEMIARLPEGETERVPKLAEESMHALLRARPFANEAIGHYLEMLKQTRGKEEAGQALNFLSEETENPRVLANWAYVLAISDLAEYAVPLYDRALAKLPDDMNIKLNRASALTRLDQWDEAIDLYKHLMENGVNSREWHFHDILDRYYVTMEYHDRLDEAREYFREFPDRIKGEWLTEALEDTGDLYVRLGDPEEANHFYDLALERTEDEDRIARVWMSKGLAWIMNGEEERGIEVFREARERRIGDEQFLIDMMMAEAKATADMGKQRESLRILLDVTRRFPDSPEGKSSWFLAGDLAEKLGEPEEAIEYYRNFLATDATLFGLRRESRNRIQLLGGAEDIITTGDDLTEVRY